jgi:hypothetical protein
MFVLLTRRPKRELPFNALMLVPRASFLSCLNKQCARDWDLIGKVLGIQAGKLEDAGKGWNQGIQKNCQGCLGSLNWV